MSVSNKIKMEINKLKKIYEQTENNFSRSTNKDSTITQVKINKNNQFNPQKKIMHTNLTTLNENFTGRKEYIKEIDDLLSKQNILVLSGNGGIGKTQIALKYIELNKDKYSNIAFINASSLDLIIQDYAKILDVNIDKNTVNLMKNWSNANKKWLFIYDNVNDKDLQTEFFENLVDSSNGKILITSRLKNWERKTLELDVFTEDESIEFLNKKTNLNNLEAARILSKNLGYFPLALEQAGSYINHSKSNYNEYIELLENEEKNIEQYSEGINNKYPNIIAKTCNISMQKITNKSSIDLMNFISFFDNANIPVIVFESGKDYLTTSITDNLDNKTIFKDIFTNLSNYSLLDFNGEYIKMHNLVQDIIRAKLDPNEWCSKCIELLKNTFYYDWNNKNTWKYTNDLMVHVVKVTKYSETQNIENNSIIYLYNCLEVLSKAQGKYKEAKNYVLKTLKINEKELGLDHPDSAQLYNNLAEVYHAQGKYKEVEECYLKILKIMEKELGLDQLYIATSYNNLAGLYQDQSKYMEAEKYYLKALAIIEKKLGLNHPYTTAAYNDLAGLYQAQEKFTESAEYYQKAINIVIELDNDHPYAATLYNDLAKLFQGQKQYPEAQECFAKALRITENKLTLDHPCTAISYNNLAVLFETQENFEDSEENYLKTLAIKEKVLGIDNLSTADTYNNLGLLYHKQGKYENSEEYSLKALVIYEKMLGVYNSSIADTYNNLGLLNSYKNNYAPAEEYYLKALAIYEKVLGIDSILTADTYNNLGLLYSDQGKYRESKDYFLKALAVKEKILGLDHSSTACTFNNLGLLFYRQGMYKESEEYYLKALNTYNKMTGTDLSYKIDTKEQLNLAIKKSKKKVSDFIKFWYKSF